MYINITSCCSTKHLGMVLQYVMFRNKLILPQIGYLFKVIVLEKRKTISALIGIFSVPNLIFSSEDGLLFSKVSPKF
jgi:hypothetical protein